MLNVQEALARIGNRTVTDDSRQLKAGDVLVWDSRISTKTAEVLADAKARGAGLILTDAAADGTEQVENAGAVLAAWAAQNWPRQPDMLGVTGTAGKTSVAWFVRQLATACGKKAASVGTLGVMRTDADVETEYTGFTSPTALKLHPILQELAGEGVQVASLEISSHALELRRTEGVKLAAAGITNMTQDHLDFHGSLEAYHAAKLRLFAELLPPNGVAVVNMNRPECWPAAAIAKGRGCPVLTVGTANAELVVDVQEASPRGLKVNLKFDETPVPVELPLIGSFQAENVAVALGLAVAGGLPWKAVAKAAATLTGVPGRMEVVKSQAPQPGVVVDYAHKPDALKRALESLRPLVKGDGKLRVVFGCGGNRDALKRPMMGQLAAQLADVVYVTDDNPRFEDPAPIRQAIINGMGSTDKLAGNFADRREAIFKAIADAGEHDVVLVAGKGHEHGQIIQGETHPFDDRDVCREALNQA
jgi:UDP-N-acetylmuramoyl-L-alanyl-D-glutamate--2,6-diaminopimelate ligase